MQLKLVVIAGASKSGEITVNPPMTFGRSRDADLTLRHALISRKHCEIAESNGQIVVRDLGSLNGTFIGGQRINEAPLKDGDELMVGSVTFRVHLSGAADAAAAAQGSIPQGVDPETGLQFLEPVDAIETVPVEQMQPVVQAAVQPVVEAEPSSESSPSIVGVLQGMEDATILPAVAEPASAVGLDETPMFVPDGEPAASQSEVSFDLNEDTPSEPESDDSALGSFLKKL
jgi:pSer/pThr/pTyr-binding forkhead associated (FHA) protein